MTERLAYLGNAIEIDIALIAFPKIGKNTRGWLELLTVLRDFRNAPFYIHCLYHMIDLRMFFFIKFYPLAPWTMICLDFDLLMLFILT